MAFKLLYDYQGRCQERPVAEASLGIGREADNGLVIDEESVSRRHARLDWDGHRLEIVDTASTNRVRVNDLIIASGEAGAWPLKDGDTVFLGSFSFRVARSGADQLVLDETRLLQNTSSIPVTDFATALEGPAAGGRPPAGADEILRRAKRVLQVVANAGRRIAGVKSLEEVLDSIVDLVFDTTTAARAAVLLWEEPAAQLVPRVVRARSGDTGQFRVSRTVVDRAYADRATVLLGGSLSTSASMHRLGLQSAVAVPLWDETRVVGVIYADAPQPDAFDPFSLDLLSALANYAAIAIEQTRLVERVKQEERARAILGRYHPRAVVERILAEGDSSPEFGFKAQEADVSVLFCDMVSFTATSHRLAPPLVMLLLNRYFSHMTEVIFEHGGTLDKFIGDCIMAVFGAPLPQPDHARRAALTALGLREVVNRLRERDGGGMEFRIGMSSGRVVAGDVGHAMRRDWTVLGDTVNVASRVQSAVAEPGQIVITGATRAELGADFAVRRLALAQLPKGISEGLEVFELLGRA